MSLAYKNATRGKVDIPIMRIDNTPLCTLSLYAPNDWSNDISLRYFIPSDNPLSKLLTHDFGTGYVMRDLSGVNWDDMFGGMLDWKLISLVGPKSGYVTQSGSTDDIMPYKGKFTLTFDQNNNNNSNDLENETLLIDNDCFENFKPALIESESELSIDDYCKKYNSYSPNGPTDSGISLSVLKKDGSWDCVYTTYNVYESILIDVDALKLNYDQSFYARSISGGLRYRLTKCEVKHDRLYNKTYHVYTTKYFTRDYTPQKANIKYSSYLSSVNDLDDLMMLNDDYFIDVKIGISDVEGTDRVIVEQLDEGERLPFRYEVKDFRKGYFIANLDRECSTQLTVVSYNNNGSTRSNTIVIPALGYSVSNLSFDLSNNMLSIQGIPEKMIESGCVMYSIGKMSDLYGGKSIAKLESTTLDLNELSNGLYVISIYDEQRQLGSFKFSK